MPFLPFYIPQRKKLKIIIIGGGYAGIAALTTFFRYMPEATITIIDPRSHHIKITHLHETFRYPLQDFMVPFASLEKRFGCHHIRKKLDINKETILEWQKKKLIKVDDKEIKFDYILITTGSTIKKDNLTRNILDLNSFFTTSGPDLLNYEKITTNKEKPYISVIGGGATGTQFLFEIAYFFKQRKIKCNLRLIHNNARILQQFPEGFSDYTESKLAKLGIDHHPNTFYVNQLNNKILLESKKTNEKFELPSNMTLLFLGNNQKNKLSANTFGQVMIDGLPLQNIFSAGDCADFDSYGSNVMSAQSAVRKGKLTARNILRVTSKIKLLEPYLHHDLGYVVNLGPEDAVGWLALENNVVNGVPALVIKELVEAQYDLLLNGIDTYLV